MALKAPTTIITVGRVIHHGKMLLLAGRGVAYRG